MTGGGTADLAFAKESTFLGSLVDEDGDGNTDYWALGRDPSLQEASLDNVLQRMHEPGAVWSVESVKDNFEGAVTVEAVINANVFGDVEDLVFNGTGSIVAGRPQTATIFAGIDYLDGTTERALEGCIPQSFQIDYTENGKNRFTLTMLYADETKGSTITPSSVTQAADGGHSAAADFDLSIDTVSIPKLQSATLSIDNIARFQRDGNPTPADVVVASPTASLDTTGIYSGPTRLEQALGAANATSPQDRINGVPATVTIDNDGTNISTYNLDTVKPATYGWQDLITGETDMTEQITWNVDGTDAVTVS